MSRHALLNVLALVAVLAVFTADGLDAQTWETSVTVARPIERPPAPNHRLRIGDIVVVHLPGEQTLNKPLQIDADGNIVLPEVGAVRIAGLSLPNARQHVRRKLHRAFRDLNRLKLILKERRLIVQVGGYVKQPGQVNLPATATVQSAIAAAGGLAQGAQLDRLQIRRGSRTVTFNYKDYLETGNPALIPTLRPLDILFVPSSPVTGTVHVEFDGRTLQEAGDGGAPDDAIKIIGEVHNPASYAFKPKATIVDMLLRAGGVTRYATVEQIRIIANGKPQLFNLKAYLDTGNRKLLPQLRRGATIFVPKQIEEVTRGPRTVYIMGEVDKPGAYEMSREATFVDILANAGGPTRFADTRRIAVIRANGAVETFDLATYAEGGGNRPPAMSPGDAVYVPEKIARTEPSWLRIPPTRAIHVIGSVKKPGRFEWSPEMSFFDILAQAGGPRERADIANIEILQSRSANAHSIRFNLEAFLKKGGSLARVPKLRSGNVIMVPELPAAPDDDKANWTRLSADRSIYIMGAIGKPGRYAFNSELSFIDILTAAEGPTQSADLRNVRIINRRVGAKRVRHVNLARFFATGDDVLLPHVRTGDVIFIPDRSELWLDHTKERTVRVLGAIAKPGRYQFTDDMTILDLLAAAGGPTTAALQTRILVVNMGLENKAHSFDLLGFAKTGDIRRLPVVRAGDTVYLPQQSEDDAQKIATFLKDATSIASSIGSVWTSFKGTASTTTTATTNATSGN